MTVPTWLALAEADVITHEQAVDAELAEARYLVDGNVQAYQDALIACGIAEDPNDALAAAADEDRGIF